MPERWRSTGHSDPQLAKVRLSRIAERQWGRVSRAQLDALGVDNTAVRRWVDAGYLHRVHPGVYAVGHSAPSVEGDLAAALLYAGPGAMLSHATAAWWLSLIDERPSIIHVSTPRRCNSLRGVLVHGRRCGLDRTWHNRLTVTTPAQALLDYAQGASRPAIRRALAEADYRRLLDPAALNVLLGRGRPGSSKLRTALAEHQPRLAATRSVLEQQFLWLCESRGIPLPEVNVRVEGWLVDAFWPEHGLVVELDGYDNHRSAAQLRRDRRKELQLRGAGLTVSRYGWEQVAGEPDAVAADVLSSLAP